MSKRPMMTTPAGGEDGEPSSGARGAGAPPPSQPVGTGRYARLQSAGTGTSAADGDRPRRRVTYMEGRFEAAEQPPTDDGYGAGDTAPPQTRTQRPRPTYTPVSQRRREPAIDEQPRLYGDYPRRGSPAEPPARTPTRPRGSRAGLGGAAGGALPPGSSSLPSPETAVSTTGGIPGSSGGAPPVQPRRGGLKTNKTIERVSTLGDEPVGLGGSGSSEPPPPPTQTQPKPEPRFSLPQQPEEGPYVDQPPKQPSSSGSGTKRPAGASPTLIRRKEKATKLMTVCLTCCCILFWLLVVCVGLAILVVYLLYHPRAPRIHVSTATLNAGYIDELPPPHLGKALNSDLYVLAAIYNPNTKVDVVLRYMQLDLYFQGRLIGTQAVWPPLYEKPGDSALRSVHLVVSEVVMTQEDAEVWKNVTTGGGLVEMHLQGKFHVQLNFGRWLPFRYTVRPTCALWLDPPPAGALRRARCLNS
uniref:Late embryogenesis abundant protein LEA-2 subgroup domain-containing protein n=2 Tax=Zea mays TaxID=4577 RepID=A0A804QX19_MAIZE